MKNLAFALAFICLLLASAMFGVPYMTKSSSARSNDLQISQKELKIWDIPKLLQSHDSKNLQDFKNADKKSSDKSKIRTPKAIVLHSSNNNNNNNNNDDDNTKSTISGFKNDNGKNLQDFKNADKKSSDKSKIRTPKAIVLHSSNNNNNNNNNDDDNTKSKAA